MKVEKEIARARSIVLTGCDILRARSGRRSLAPALWAMLVGVMLAFHRGEFTWSTGYLFAQLLVIALFDARYMLIPIWMTIALAGCGLSEAVLLDQSGIVSRLCAGAMSYLLMRGVDAAYFKLAGRHGLGRGDANLLAAGSLWIGLDGVGPALLIATLTAILAALISQAEGTRVHLATAIPFGPHLVAGIWLTWVGL